MFPTPSTARSVGWLNGGPEWATPLIIASASVREPNSPPGIEGSESSGSRISRE